MRVPRSQFTKWCMHALIKCCGLVQVGLIIDLTNTWRYYERDEIDELGIEHLKVTHGSHPRRITATGVPFVNGEAVLTVLCVPANLLTLSCCSADPMQRSWPGECQAASCEVHLKSAYNWARDC